MCIMNTFSLFNYENLSDSQKASFNKDLAMRLSSILNDIKGDGDLEFLDIDGFIASASATPGCIKLVSDLYSKLSAGIQVGSGNQNLFQAVLSAFTESWKQINKK